MLKFLRRNLDRVRRGLGAIADFRAFSGQLDDYRALVRKLPPATQGSLLIVSGRGMNVLWAQLWSLLSLPIRQQGLRGLVLTTRGQRLLNLYFRLLQLELVYLEDHPPAALPGVVQQALDQAAKLDPAEQFDRYRSITYLRAPVGQIALSTYSRHFGTGVINFADPTVAAYVHDWVGMICRTMDLATRLFEQRDVRMLFFTEVFMEEYGAFYYAALNAELNVIRFAGTVRDDAYIMQHLSHSNDRMHHSSIAKSTFERLLAMDDDERMLAELQQNFLDRYGHKWHRSKRNHPNTQILDPAQARVSLGLPADRKVAVIYSHILYDTLFFFGTDLFQDYAAWLVETVRAALDNPEVTWLIKVHPSNLWRGELDSLLKGRFEEERLLHNTFGDLPAHVRIIGPDTPINPYTWFQLADYGITVRGTSGLEMAALGKTVITAGTGRYEGNGFTVDPPSAAAYQQVLRTLHQLPPPDAAQIRRAQRYAHGIFVLKPFTLSCAVPRLRAGQRVVYASDDLLYQPAPLPDGKLPADLAAFGAWAFKTDDRDLLAR